MGERLIAAAREWLAGDPDPETRAELSALLDRNAEHELAERFAAPLEFGTAGLRGVVGAGLSRMNRAVVIRTTRGLGEFLASRRSGARNLPVIVGYDARPQSLRFAADAAGVLLAMGITVRVFEREVPTPLVAYAARGLSALAAIMITASHNPREYNGYKIYLDDGIQLTPPADRQIADFIAGVGPAKDVPRVEIEATPESLLAAAARVPAELFERYLAEVTVALPEARAPIRIAYSPLHGVGWHYLRRAFEYAGFADVRVVSEQAEPDGSFPGTPFPNPEEPKSVAAALRFAAQEKAELLLINDPDADRLSAAVPAVSGEFRQLSGNQIGLLLADALLDRARESGAEKALVVGSIVTTPLLSVIARARGAHFEQTLTGFKWIWTAAHELMRERSLRFVFACEEALGYSVSPAVRDKDGISAALCLARIASRLRENNQSLLDRLGELYRQYGLWVSVQHNLLSSVGIDRLAQQPPGELGGRKVSALRDYRIPGARPRWLASAELLELELEGGGRVLVRPSGTEPKLKIYVDLPLPLAAAEPWSSAYEQGSEQAFTIARAIEAALV
jgi:phosphomannomutase